MIPSAPPDTPSDIPSTSSWRTIRPRPAPSARRRLSHGGAPRHAPAAGWPRSHRQSRAPRQRAPRALPATCRIPSQIVLAAGAVEQAELRPIAIGPSGSVAGTPLKRGFHHALSLSAGDARLQPPHDEHPPVVRIAQHRTVRHVAIRRDQRLRGERHHHVGRVARLEPCEAGRCHSDNGHGNLVDSNAFPDRRRPAPEPARPISVADDGDGLGSPAHVVSRHDRATRDRRHAHTGEKAS